MIISGSSNNFKILLDASTQERQILSGFRYAPNKVVLHDDINMLPKKNWARASWNYQKTQLDDTYDKLTMTYYLNKLFKLFNLVSTIAMTSGLCPNPLNLP